MARRTHTLESFGVAYSLAIADGLPPSWRIALPPFTKPSRLEPARRFVLERNGRRMRLSVDGTELGTELDVRSMQDLLEGELALFVAAHAPQRIFIHAGVVEWKGRALLMPGRTMSGKSTLVAALLARGATYYSDEYAVLDELGRVHAYPRRLSLRRPAGLPRRIRARRTGRAALPVGWVLGLRFDPTQTLRMTSLTAGRTALLLLNNAVAARISPARVLATLAQVTRSATGWEGLRGDAKRAAAEVLSRCER